MEKEVKISLESGKELTGLLRGGLVQPLAVFVHGLTGDIDSFQPYNLARYLEERGISFYRYDLYSATPFVEATLASHAAELDQVVAHFRDRGVKDLFVIGHSYGGPTILLSNAKDFDRIVLWDPSYNINLVDSRKYAKVDIKLEPLPDGRYIRHTNPDVVYGKPMVDEATEVPWDDLAKDVTVPLKVIAAGQGVLIEGSKCYVANAQGKTAYVEIREAGHNFAEDGVAEKLFAETYEWLK